MRAGPYLDRRLVPVLDRPTAQVEVECALLLLGSLLCNHDLTRKLRCHLRDHFITQTFQQFLHSTVRTPTWKIGCSSTIFLSQLLPVVLLLLRKWKGLQLPL